MASSSSSLRNWLYDVFPSFSGEDVRLTFLSNFLKELDRKLIIAFKDNKIERGRSLDPELKQAIKDSRIAVVVFSKHYASSTWCLNELLEIVKCKEEYGQTVIPVFYALDPSDVRKQTGDFGKIFEKTCRHNKTEEVLKTQWREALTNVANTLGYHTRTCCNEAKMIEEIADDILVKLLLTTSNDFEEFVGMEDHLANMSVLLELESEEVRMVGIWGSSGIGKTTIARVLFNQISRHFQGSVFIDKHFISKSKKIYRKGNPDDHKMKLHLQENFLSTILDKEGIKVNHLGAVREKLKHRKVLIIFDDLDDQVVLDALAGEIHWFGCGSRIIVVTKDKQFCRANGIDHVYEVCLPSDSLSLEMFCRSALRQNSPPDSLKELTSEVAWLAGNLPLGLNVLGSLLRGRDVEDWTDMMPRLQNGLDGKIERTLRVSYDGLNKKDKAIFCYIACFFNGETVNDIKLLLADSHLDVNIGLKNLVDKSLIHVRENIVEMHCLLQDMGTEIVCAQSNDPGEREFIVDLKDVCNVLQNNTGTKKVVGIVLDVDEIDELHIHENAFKEMHNLLFLKLYTKQCDLPTQAICHLPKGFDYFPNKLRLLRFDGYPMRYLPSNFRPENLVKLQMMGSKLERLWEGVHSLSGLKDIDLQKSRCLQEIPNLSMAINLETLDLTDCSSLEKLPFSIQHLNKLEFLVMSGCINLESLPNGINLQSLYRLDLSRCSRLKSFPDISTNISALILCESGIEEFPCNVLLKKLVILSMVKMKSEKLWEREQPLTSLMTMLAPSLERLFLSDIPTLVELPSSLQKFDKLQYLLIRDCINLENLPTGINFQYLYHLDLRGCSRLRTFPCISTNISRLYLTGTGTEEVPWWIKNFYKLRYLEMESCNSLKRVSLNIYKLKHIRVDFSDCWALTKDSWIDNPSALEMETDNIHSKLTVPKESSSPLPNDVYRNLGFTFMFFNLDPEAILQQQSIIFNSMLLSGEEVPSYFTHCATGTSSLMNIPLLPTNISEQFFKFRVCAVVIFGSVPISSSSGVIIHVNCRFKDSFGNGFDLVGQPHCFCAYKKGGHLCILDCRIPLNKNNNTPLVQLWSNHVDMHIHVSHIQDVNHIQDMEYSTSNSKLKGWGIRLLEDYSSADTRLQLRKPMWRSLRRWATWNWYQRRKRMGLRSR